MRRPRLWENLPLGAKGLVVIAVPLLSLVAAAVLSYFVTQDGSSNDEVYVATYLQGVHADVQGVLFLVQDAETGVRSYILTGEKPFLRRYYAAGRELPALLDSLNEKRRDLLRDDLGIDDSGAEGARALLQSLPELEALDSDLAAIDRLVPERLQTLGELVDYGRAVNSPGDLDAAPPEELSDMLTGRVALIQVLNHTSKHIQPQLLSLANSASEEQARRGREQVQLIVAVAVLGLIGGLVSVILFTRTITRRIALLEVGAASLAAGSAPSDLPQGRDAIGRLASRFEETSGLLVTREQGLRAAKEEADRANQAKSEFLSRMSHELRTPLNAILGFGQLLQMDSLKPRQKSDLDQIMKAGKHLLELINEVLDIASVEAGRLSLSVEPVSVDEIVADAVSLVSPLAAQRGVKIATHGDKDGTFAAGDRQRLKQVLLNLLSNGVKYNREAGTVDVVVGRSGEGVSIAVADSGPGIARNQMERLFVPFERLDAPETEVEGTGLGLALSKRLIEAMHGSIEVHSEPGKGSTFTVTLPQASAPGTRAELPASSSADIAADTGEPRTVLYIEDNPSNLKLVEQILSYRPNFEIHSAVQGGLGVDLARKNHFDVILLDLDLPDIGGSEVLKLLKEQPETRDVPVIVVTADATPGRAERLLDQGAIAYVAKPLDVAEFLSVLDGVLERASVR